MSSRQVVQRLQKTVDLALKKQTQDGLSKVFTVLSCKGVAKEIKAGRNVTGNAEYGIRHCVHEKVGPRVNVETMQFIPQTMQGKRIEERFIKLANGMLKNGGFKQLSPRLLADLRRRDREFEETVRKRRK